MKNIFLITILSMPFALFAQSEHRSLVSGNSLYKDKDYKNAITEYEKVLQLNKKSVKGQYNLGNALYETNKFERAIEHYIAAVENATDDEIKSKAYHNLGNAYAKVNQNKEAVGAYKNSLRINPNDKETKYNLAKTLKKIQPPPPEENKQNNQNEQKEEDKPKEEEPKDEIDRMMDMMDNEDKKTQENKKNPQSRRRKPEKDW